MTWVKDIELVAGAPQKLAVELAEENTARASLVFESPEGAAIFVDEKRRSSVVPASIEIAPGPHAVALRVGDTVVWETALQCEPNTQYVFAPEPTMPVVKPTPAADAGSEGIIEDDGPDAGAAPTERTGEPPRIRARNNETLPKAVNALVCIDRRGRVQSVRVDEAVAPRISRKVDAAVRKWSYKPYLRDHKPVPACFDETISIQIER
jgi:hypothetical protein